MISISMLRITKSLSKTHVFVALFMISLTFKCQLPVTWDFQKGVSISSGLVTKTATSNNYGSSGVISGNVLEINQDGWAEFIVSAAGEKLCFGFIRTTDNINIDEDTEIFSLSQFRVAVELQLNNKLKVFRNGELIGQFGNYLPNDKIKIEKIGNNYFIKRNGLTLTTLEIAQPYALRVKVGFKTPQSSINEPQVSFIKPLFAQANTSNAFCSSFQKGSVNIVPEGGTAPYSYTWFDNSTESSKNNLKPGTYSVTINDAEQRSFVKSFELNSCVKWEKLSGISATDTGLTKIINTNNWNDNGASSLNTLKTDRNGSVYYNYDASIKDFALGFGFNDTLITLGSNSIDFCYLVDKGNLFVTNKGIIVAEVGKLKKGDLIKISKINSNIEYSKNGIILFTQLIDNIEQWDFRIELALRRRNANIQGVYATFFKPDLEITSFKNDVSFSESKSGYIILNTKYGLPPYSYNWNSGSNEEAIYDLGIGEYQVMIKDTLGDSVIVKNTIGIKAEYGDRSNVAILSDGLTKINTNELAATTLKNFVKSNEDGWIEFKILNKEQNYNVLFREFDNQDTLYTDEDPITNTVASSTIIVLTQLELSRMDTVAFNNLNTVDTTLVFSMELDSVSVIAQQFTDGTGGSVGVLTNEHGVLIKNGDLYVLNSGITLNKPVRINNNDVVRLTRTNGDFKVTINTNQVFLGGINLNKNLAVDINLSSPLVSLGNILLDGIGFQVEKVCFSELNKNWNGVKHFDGLGNAVLETRQYLDVLGRPTQGMKKDITKNNVIATQTIYDAFGRAVLQTLPAPTFQTQLCYKENFVNNTSNTPYTYNNFDKPNYSSNPNSISLGERDNPEPLSTSIKGTLGWYYSIFNVDEQFIPSASNPYTRIEYSITNPSSILKASKAGSVLKHGAGHEGYNYSMRTAGELYYFLGFLGSWKITDMNSHFNFYDACKPITDVITEPYSNTQSNTMKKISVDENGVEIIEFYDVMGNMIGKCLSGSVDGNNQKVQALRDYIDVSPGSVFPFIDVHLPLGCENSLVLNQLYNYANVPQIVYNIVNLKTEQYVKWSNSIDFIGTNPNLPPGFYRIKVKSLPTTHPNAIAVNYSTNYYDFSAYYYDKANRLRLIVPPKGLDYSGGDFNTPVQMQTMSSPFGPVNSNITTTYQGPNTIYTPNWLLTTANMSNSEMAISLPYYSSSNSVIRNMVVSFTGKGLSYAIDVSSNDNPTSQNRMIGGGSGGVSEPSQVVFGGDVALPIYQIDSTDVEYAYPNQNVYYNDTNIVQSSYASAYCGQTVVPVSITYQLRDQNNVAVSGIETITGYCNIIDCGTSYSKTWSFPPPKVYQVANLNSPANFVFLKILDLHMIKTPNNANFSTNLYTDITAYFAAGSGVKAGNPEHTMTEVFDYNNWGQILTNKKPDAGTTDFVYSPDGKSRFVQNAKQNIVQAIGPGQNGDKFSYTNFDQFNRPLITGEYKTGLTLGSHQKVQFQNYSEYAASGPPSGMLSAVSVANSNASIDETIRTSEKVFNMYDTPDPNFIAQTGITASTFIQRYLIGQLSYSYNSNKKTWYSYDELGRIKWVVQRYEGIPDGANGFTVKSFYYEYDYLGNLMAMKYNYHLTAGFTDKIEYYYTYDSDKRLARTQSLIYGPATKGLRTDAEYQYYLTGQKKRCQLGNNLQGIDYAYTINGWLKNINSPELDWIHDPGQDAGVNNPTPNRITYPDIFGMTLDYFENDYEKVYTYVQTYVEPPNSTTTYAPDIYNGIIKAQRWKTLTPAAASNIVFQNQHFIYGYKYDKKYQLKNATFGILQADGNQNGGASQIVTPFISFNDDYKVYGINYDANGNILNLNRNAYSTGVGGLFMDNLSYSYQNCTNKLNSAGDAITSNVYNNFGFKSGQSPNNYVQNVLGELDSDLNGNKAYDYNSDGQISAVKSLIGNSPLLEFTYDEMGRRILKTSYSGSNVINTFYVRDVEGDIIAIHERVAPNTNYDLKELNLFGAGRVGTAYMNGNQSNYVYELNDHLGSTRATFEWSNKQNLMIDFNTPNNPDDIYFIDPNNTITGLPNSFNTVSRPFAPSKIIGITSKDIPAVYGDALTSDVYAQYTGNFPVSAELRIDLIDESGFVYATASAPVTSASQNNYNQIGTALVHNNSNLTNGFFRVYVRNPSPFPVNFDILALHFTTGGVKAPNPLDIINYYPHGSVLPGLNYNNSLGGRYAYQGQFTETENQINELSFELRNYNPLLGRFATTDPYDQYNSPYIAMGNNNPNMIDPDGGAAGIAPSIIGAGVGAGLGIAAAIALDNVGTGKNNRPGRGDLGWGWYVGAGVTGAAAGAFGFAMIANGGLDGANVFGWEFRDKLYSGWRADRIPTNMKFISEWKTVQTISASNPLGALGTGFALSIPVNQRTRIKWNHFGTPEITTVQINGQMYSSLSSYGRRRLVGSFYIPPSSAGGSGIINVTPSNPSSDWRIRIQKLQTKSVPRWHFWRRGV